MGSFFHGWRRKVGALTLLISLALMTGWIRSWTVTDRFTIRSGDHVLHWFISGNDYFGWVMIRSEDPFPASFCTGWETTNYPLFSAVYASWRSKLGRFRSLAPVPNPHVIIPYAAIALPTTFLSAFLLLSKPRLSTQQKITEGIPEN
jgi:hypothetical protein